MYLLQKREHREKGRGLKLKLGELNLIGLKNFHSGEKKNETSGMYGLREYATVCQGGEGRSPSQSQSSLTCELTNKKSLYLEYPAQATNSSAMANRG